MDFSYLGRCVSASSSFMHNIRLINSCSSYLTYNMYLAMHAWKVADTHIISYRYGLLSQRDSRGLASMACS